MGHGTPIGRARGLGSAHHGAHHWLLQRFTAIGNLVLMSWLVVSFALLPDFTHETVSGWLASPISALAMALLVISTFWHARLGLQVLIEDYVHDAALKFASLALLNLAVFAGAGFALLSIGRVAFAAMGA